MIYKISGIPIWAVCISTKRPSNVQKIKKHIDTSWYVCPNEKKAYEDQGAKNVIEVSGNIVAARNKAIIDAKLNKCSLCLQLSDDVTRFYEYLSETKAVTVNFDYVFKKMVHYATHENVKLVGLSINQNARNYKKNYYTVNKLVVNDCILGDVNFLYDEKADLKEDYDMFLSLVTRGHKVVRIDNLAGAFPHRENKGGANTYRTFFREQKCNAYISNKWKHFVRTHKTRVNQLEIVYQNIPQPKL